MTRLNKEKGAWEIIKYRVFQDEQIKMKYKFDLWNAAIVSKPKYGRTTLRIAEITDRGIQQFASRCMGGIIYPKQNDDIIEYANRNTNQENRTKNCIPTIHSQLQKRKSATYTDGEQL